MSGNNETFGKNLRKIIKAKDITFGAAADKIGISLTFLNALMADEKRPSFKTLEKIRAGLEVTMAALEDSPAPEKSRDYVTLSDLHNRDAKLLEAVEGIRVSTQELAEHQREIGRLERELDASRRINQAVDKRVFLAWPMAQVRAQEIALYFLTGDVKHLKTLAPALRKKMEAEYRDLGLDRPTPPASNK